MGGGVSEGILVKKRYFKKICLFLVRIVMRYYFVIYIWISIEYFLKSRLLKKILMVF